MKMKSRIILDCAMLIVLLTLMAILVTGVIIHEILGIVFAALAAAHIWVNKSAMKNTRKKGRLILNVILLASFLTATVSGVLISVSLFRFLNIPYRDFYYSAHSLSARVLFISSLIHLGFHMKIIKAFFTRKPL